MAEFEKTEEFRNMSPDQKNIASAQMRDKITRRQRNDRNAVASQMDAEEQIVAAAVIKTELDAQKDATKQGTKLSSTGA